MTQHTPGPWTIDHQGQIITKERTGASHEIIAHMPAWFATAKAGAHASQDHILSNARLIAAAPELLAALQSITASYDKLLIAYAKPHEWGTIESDNARAAIADAQSNSES